MTSIFWAAVVFIIYAYAGYPLMLLLIGAVRRCGVRRGPITPRVSLVITARNEAQRIREKIENTLAQDYPSDRLEVIVASDASDDGTDGIVRAYAERGVRLVRSPVHRGKEAAQKLAVERSSGDILVFSDVATVLEPDSVRRIVANFHDPTVGCVSSVDRLLERTDQKSGEGAYVRYEMALRALETRTGTVVGLSGSFFAARRDVSREWAVDVPSDFNTLLSSVRLGLRGVSDPNSVGYYRALAHESREFDRKVRTVVRGIGALTHSPSMLDPFRYGLFAWQLLSHKVCRWLVPFAMATAFVSNAALASRSSWYLLIFAAQCGFYGVAVWGLLRGARMSRAWLRIPSFFLLANVSIVAGWYRYMRGDRMLTWTPSER